MARAATVGADPPPPVAGRVAAAQHTAITCTGVTVRFVTDRRTVTALDGVSFEVAEGSFLTVLGPSGCCKSTLLRVVADLMMPRSGSVTVRRGTPKQAPQRRMLGVVFQDATLLPSRTALW